MLCGVATQGVAVRAINVSPILSALRGPCFQPGREMPTYHFSALSGCRAADQHSDYIARRGKYKSKSDNLIATGTENLPPWAASSKEFWRAARQFERKNGATYRELHLAAPAELSQQQNLALLQTWVGQEFPGKTVEYAYHDTQSSVAARSNPHFHVMYSDRMQDEFYREPEVYFRRHNSRNPQLGGCRKDSGGLTPNEMGQRLKLQRERWEEHLNDALRRAGIDSRVDHRSLTDRGIDRKPESHLGPAAIRRMSADEKANLVSQRSLSRTPIGEK